MGRRPALIVLVVILVMATTGGVAGKLAESGDGRTHRHDRLEGGIPPEDARNVTFLPGGCVSWQEGRAPGVPAVPFDGMRSVACAPDAPNAWETGEEPVVAVARLTVDGSDAYHAWSRVARLQPGEYVLDAENTTLTVAYPVMPRGRASALELVPADDPANRTLLVFEDTAFGIGRAGPVTEDYWYKPGFMLRVTPQMFRLEQFFVHACPTATLAADGTVLFPAPGRVDHVAMAGEPAPLVRFAGTPESPCPPATMTLEALGPFTWSSNASP